MATPKEPVCESCIDAVVASAKAAGEDHDNADFIHTVAVEFGAGISDHFCEGDENEEVDCTCGCRFGMPWGSKSFGTLTTRGNVCESCIFAVNEAVMSLGMQPDDIMYTYMLARTNGGGISDHWCDADDDVECNCGCQ